MITYRTAILWFIAASLADLLTTVVGLDMYGLRELNPVPAALHATYGWIGLTGLTIAGIVSAIALCTAMIHLHDTHGQSIAKFYVSAAAMINTLIAGSNGLMIASLALV